MPSEPKPPAFIPPYVRASEQRTRFPMWVLPVIAFLPIWGILYAQSLSAAPSKELSPLAAGAAIYSANQCAGCHGPTGGGGVGPQLSDGEVLKTFPNIASQIEWVSLGSEGHEGNTYGATAKPKQGGMPGFHASLTQKELLEVIRHERETMRGEELDPAQLSGGERLWPNGEPMLDEAGELVWDDGEPMLDEDGALTKPVADPAAPAG